MSLAETDFKSTDRSMILVSGYHEFSVITKEVKANALGKRFAFITSTFDRTNPSAYFDYEIFFALIESLKNFFKPDSIETEIGTFDECKFAISKAEVDDKEPPKQIIFKKDNQVVAILLTEYWTLIGGPQPYHDSYTFALFTRENHDPEMQALAARICQTHDTFVKDFYKSSDIPVKTPLWKTLLRLLK